MEIITQQTKFLFLILPFSVSNNLLAQFYYAMRKDGARELL